MSPSAISSIDDFDSHYINNMGNLTAMNLKTNIPRTLAFSASQSSNDTLDLVCIGFGPASLAIAIALHDKFSPTAPGPKPKTLFLEKQPQFSWHAGMQLPGAKMQISFLKDLATPRDPRSKFTFTNYLFIQGRLNQFINLGTFLPTRVEYEDYLRWCAGHFERQGKVAYGTEVQSVRPASYSNDGRVTSWEISARDSIGDLVVRKAKHVVIAVGGKPIIPNSMQDVRNVAHSSQFATTIGKIQDREKGRRPRFAVVGSGQSAAEIFNDLWSRFPDSELKLVIRGASLRPSDDSPFVNEIFDPDRVDGIYTTPAAQRAAQIALDKGTNYGVVRLTLLEHLYEQQYIQRLRQPDPSKWRCQILSNRSVISATNSKAGAVTLRLGVYPEDDGAGPEGEEELEVDYVFVATGYKRNAHEEILCDTKSLLSEGLSQEGKFKVGRNYRVLFDEEKVDKSQTGVWLQGCNEVTHGLSDTLLSILAIRGDELVHSIFGENASSSASESTLSETESGMSSPA